MIDPYISKGSQQFLLVSSLQTFCNAMRSVQEGLVPIGPGAEGFGPCLPPPLLHVSCLPATAGHW